MHELFVPYVRRVRGVEEDEAPVLQRVIYEIRKGLAGQHRPGRVVGTAKVDNVDFPGRKLGLETVLGVRGEQYRAPPRHQVAVQIYRVHRVGDGDAAIGGKKLLKVRHVALRAVADEDLVRREFHAARSVFAAHDRFAQKFVALLGAVAPETLARTHLVHRAVHRGDDRRDERGRHVADPELDHVGVRVGGLVLRDLFGDGGKEVAFGEFRVVRVQNRFIHFQ